MMNIDYRNWYDLSPVVYRAFDQRRQSILPPQASKQEQESQTDDDPALLCIGCRGAITSKREAIEIAGAHCHTCTNPHGFTYTIGCFTQAPGTRAEGPKISADSWFLGYRWQLALCGGCQLHLGWRFSGPDAFYGLILNRLLIPPAQSKHN